MKNSCPFVVHSIRHEDKVTSLRFRLGAFTWSKRVKRNSREASSQTLVTEVERSELCRATVALSIMDRDTLTCVPAGVADGVLALQLPGKSCGDSCYTLSGF